MTQKRRARFVLLAEFACTFSQKFSHTFLRLNFNEKRQSVLWPVESDQSKRFLSRPGTERQRTEIFGGFGKQLIRSEEKGSSTQDSSLAVGRMPSKSACELTCCRLKAGVLKWNTVAVKEDHA